MPRINASLFVHILNDPFLTGTYKLEGNYFINTIQYLNDYLKHLTKTGQSFPPKYLQLLEKTSDLQEIEQDIEKIINNNLSQVKDHKGEGQDHAKAAEAINKLAEKIVNKISRLAVGSELMLPGGWLNETGGHAMVYQFSRTTSGFEFTVYNSGAGIREYHAKMSSLHKEKELYNPMKKWRINIDFHNPVELNAFIKRLIKARLPVTDKTKKQVDAQVLYQEVLASISPIEDREIDASVGLSPDAFTAGQLSGTCAQRCLHQMLKIVSESHMQFEQFIFDFKLYALHDYVELCLKGEEPFNAAVAEQIHFAIENNLKILTGLNLTIEQKDAASKKLIAVRNRVTAFKPIKPEKKEARIYEYVRHLAISHAEPKKPEAKPDEKDAKHTSQPQLLAPVSFDNGKKLLENMAKAITDIEKLNEPAAKFNYLQQIFLALPFDQNNQNVSLLQQPFYAELQTKEDYLAFQKLLGRIQTQLSDLRDTWLGEASTPSFDVIALLSASLQVETYDLVNQKSDLPSFKLFTPIIMQSLLGNTYRNPFWATLHPQLDQKFKALQSRYIAHNMITDQNFYNFLNQILATEAHHNKTLVDVYNRQYGNSLESLHIAIKQHKLQALYVLSRIWNTCEFGELKPIVDKLKAYLNFDAQLLATINPLLLIPKTTAPFLEITLVKNTLSSQLQVKTALNPVSSSSHLVSTKLLEYKYKMENHPAHQALSTDVGTDIIFYTRHQQKTANQIQLNVRKQIHPSEEERSRPITQEDIIARDYSHMRIPQFQIVLTLDYFTRNIDKLATVENQLYVEANIFQPGLLLTAANEQNFLSQFDTFLTTGLRFHSENSQHCRESLFFVRLDYLVSRYLSLIPHKAGLDRLKNLQNELLKHLSFANPPEVTYFLQQYLFLTLVSQIELGQDPKLFFEILFSAYFYIQSNPNPNILEDQAHTCDVAVAIAQFQLVISQQAAPLIQAAVEQALTHCKQYAAGLKLSGAFPIYQLVDRTTNKVLFDFNAHLGKLFKDEFAYSGVPIKVKNHELIKHLGLADVNECLMTADGSHMILEHDRTQVHLFYEDTRLTAVHKIWDINGQKQRYELQALTYEHLAKRVRPDDSVNSYSIPRTLKDGSIDYWANLDNATVGILVQNNTPIYVKEGNNLHALSATGAKTSYSLVSIDSAWSVCLNKFEDSEFIVTQIDVAAKTAIFKLPRYNLSFVLSANSGILTYPETHEQVIDGIFPLGPDVASLVLANQAQQTRLLVPITRFYATERDAQESAFYPVIHDVNATIDDTIRAQYYKDTNASKSLLWNLQNSQQYISFQLKDGKPVASSTVDALYLAYVYLATNQPQLAWDTLEYCTNYLGGLSGNTAELKFIVWLCQDAPHILVNAPKELQNAIRQTPVYVAIRLKALALLCDYLLDDGKFTFKTVEKPKTANDIIDMLTQQNLQDFLKSLPKIIYQSYQRLQSMRRHQKYTYLLSASDRLRLLDYYHQSLPQDSAPLGALGYEWMNLSLEIILKEHDTLLAKQTSNTLSATDAARLAQLEDHLKQTKPVLARSTKLELISIDLSLPKACQINTLLFAEQDAYRAYSKWDSSLPQSDLSFDALSKALALLSSQIAEVDFFSHFPAYLQIAIKEPKASRLKGSLRSFCTNTLIANRHIALDQQSSNIPLLVNVLYRLLENGESFSKQLSAHYYDTVPISTILEWVATYPVTELRVLQAKDVHQEILATPGKLIAQERPARSPLSNPPFKNGALISHMGITSLDEAIHTTITTTLTQYHTLETQCAEALDKLAHTSKQAAHHNFAEENEAGKIRLGYEQEQNKIAQKFLTDKALISALLVTIDKALVQQEEQLEQAFKEALALANQGPSEPKQAQLWDIERHAQARAVLNRKDLLALYCQADATYSAEKTGLAFKDLQQLHNLIHIALIRGIIFKVTKKIKNTLARAQKSNSISLASQALDLLSRNEIPGLDDPTRVIIQHEEGLLLRSRQVSSLETLLKSAKNGKPFVEMVEKIIPGGGKSKVMLPTLAQKKAHGDNLVIIEVPRPLLPTNYVDLNRTSMRLFGKRAYRFEFSRDSNCSPKRLERIYKHFTEIMANRGYLITTGDSMQSLELKYLELLRTPDHKDTTWQAQVAWLDKITNLLRQRGDCTIDEVHRKLLLKQKLNYTSGEPTDLSPELISNAIALFSLIDTIDTDFIKRAPSLDVNFDWAPFKLELATKLVKDSSSPLHGFVKNAIIRYGATVTNELIGYLTNNVSSLPAAILHASHEDQNACAFFRRQIDVLLPRTLSQKLDVNYGASHRTGLTPVEYTLAIPYLAKDKPNEQNRWGIELEAINYAAQKMIIEGISKELLIQQLRELLALARRELFQKPELRHLNDTPTAKGFALLTKELGLRLSQVNEHDDVQINNLHKLLRHNRTLIFKILQEQTFKLIKKDSIIIHSDSFNHVDLYRSTQGFSGTPKPCTYHQRLHYNRSSSLGTDGYVVNIIRDKKTNVSACDYHSVDQFLTSTLGASKSRANCRAIIDINATFNGISNHDFAKETAAFLSKHPDYFDTQLKHVLYFNDANVLCAISLAKPEETIILATSDPDEIERILGSKPEERFSYYSQEHTEGTDILQADTSHALVLIDDKVTLQACVQGCLRMRGLSKEQTIEFIVPARMKNSNCEQLITRLISNEERDAAIDNLVAAKAQLTNHLRRDLLTRIQELPLDEIETKAALAQHFKCFFIENPTDDLFALYGHINKNQDASAILSAYRDKLIKNWIECLTSAKIILTSAQIQEANDALQAIIDTALAYCAEKYDVVEESFASQVQIQHEIHKQIEVELLTLKECYDPKLIPHSNLNWGRDPEIIIETFTKPKDSHIALNLNAICQRGKLYTNLFSTNLLVSRNYSATYEFQTQAIGAYLKPVFLVCYYSCLINGKNTLSAMLITPQEADEIIPLLARINVYWSSWIETNLGNIVAGTRTKELSSSEDYQSLNEQVRFFNGDIASLINQDVPLTWIKQNSTEKIEFFENRLLCYRPNCINTFNQLKEILTQPHEEGFVFIADHPFRDLSEFNWLELYPKLLKSQIIAYQNLAKAFADINKNWMNPMFAFDDTPSRYNLPLSSLKYLEEHTSYLKNLHKILNPFRSKFDAKSSHSSAPASRGSNSVGTPFLLTLSQEDRECLEKILGMPLQGLLEQYHLSFKLLDFKMRITDYERESLEKASLKTLHILLENNIVYDKSSIEILIANMAKHTSSKDILSLLVYHAKTDKYSLLIDILEHCLCDTSVVNLIFKEIDINKISPHELNLLARKKLTSEQIDTLLNHRFTNEEILRLILRKDNLTVGQLQKIINLTTNEDILKLVYNKLSTAEEPSSLICDLIKQIFVIREQIQYSENAVSVDNFLFKIHMEYCDIASKQISNLLREDVAYPQTSFALMRLFDNKFLSSINIAGLIRIANEEELEILLKVTGIRAVLTENALELLAQRCNTTKLINRLLELDNLGETTLQEIIKHGDLIFQNLVASHTEAKLEIFLNPGLSFSDNQLISLANKITAPSQIEKLLNHPGMQRNIAEIIFSKPGYHGKIESWPWLSEQQLIRLLDKAQDYASLNKALTHPNLTVMARDKWLADMKQAHLSKPQPSNQQQKIAHSLSELKIKACIHAIEALQEPLPKYAPVAAAAYNLHRTLTHQYTADPGNFRQNSLQEINLVKDILNDHRGYKQWLLDFVNIIIYYSSFKTYENKSKGWRFFEVNTETMKIANKIIKTCQENSPPVAVDVNP